MGVPTSEIITSNQSLSTSSSPNPTAVFVGGTSGIGLGALQALLKHTARPTVYIVGRSLAKLDTLITSLKAEFNKTATLIPIHAADLTFVKDAEQAAAEIASQTQRVDLLILSPGYVTFTGREEHPAEGIDKVTAVRYYSRMAFVLGLQKQLQTAPAPRVISVLAAGQEGTLFTDDLLLREEGHYTTGITGTGSGAAAAMNSLFLEYIATQPGWEKTTFAHIFPGLVKTSLDFRGLSFPFNYLFAYIAQPLIGLVARSLQDAGERVLFVGTSERFGRGSDGNASYLVQGDTAIATPTNELVKLRKDGAGKMVYDHTVEVLGRVERGLRA